MLCGYLPGGLADRATGQNAGAGRCAGRDATGHKGHPESQGQPRMAGTPPANPPGRYPHSTCAPALLARHPGRKPFPRPAPIGTVTGDHRDPPMGAMYRIFGQENARRRGRPNHGVVARAAGPGGIMSAPFGLGRGASDWVVAPSRLPRAGRRPRRTPVWTLPPGSSRTARLPVKPGDDAGASACGLTHDADRRVTVVT